MWSDLNTLLSVKIECHRDALEAGAGGTLSVNKGAETFTLSWFEQISLSICRLPVCTKLQMEQRAQMLTGVFLFQPLRSISLWDIFFSIFTDHK